MKPNEVLPKQMHVPPLKQGEEKTFMLIGAGKLGNIYDSETGIRKPVFPAVYTIPEHETVTNPETGSKVQIGNVVSQKPITRDGETHFDPICKPIWFEKGKYTCTYNENDTYMFLMRLNGNADNPFRDKTKKIEFQLIDQEKAVREAIIYDALEDDAILLLKESDYESLIAIATNIAEPFKKKLNLDLPIDQIRLDLRTIIRNGNPEAIIKASTSTYGRVKVQIIEAEKWGVLKSSQQNRAWYDADNNKVLEVDPTNNMLDTMVDWIINDKKGTKFYQETLTPQLKTFKTEDVYEIKK